MPYWKYPGKMEQLKKNDNIYYWYQADLVKKLKERKSFFNANKTKIAKSLFRAIPGQCRIRMATRQSLISCQMEGL